MSGDEIDEQLPASDAAPAVLVAPTNDYSQVVRQLDDMQARIDGLRARARFLDRSATVHILSRFTELAGGAVENYGEDIYIWTPKQAAEEERDEWLAAC